MTKKHKPIAEQGQRQLRVGEQLRHALVGILRDHHLLDPDLVGRSVTVTQVKVSPDLKLATIFVHPLGGANTEQLVAALDRANGYFRGRLGHLVNLRFTPRLHFVADHSFDHVSRISELLDSPEIKRDIDQK